MKLICHKITEPSAQIPTFKGLDNSLNAREVTKSLSLPLKSQHIRRQYEIFINSRYRHKITEPSAQIPTKRFLVDGLIFDEELSQNH